MNHILVIYYSQTGQSKLALEATLQPFLNNSSYLIHYHLIKPKKQFPYPWKYTQFFDAFPETVHGVACELDPINIDSTINYSLIVVGYQPWFLNVCIPINSFLKTVEARQLLNGKPVITIINCRNMWLGAQEKMKQYLLNLNANLVGNITFVDRSANLISLITVLAFVLKGKKEKFMGIFPKYGINQKDLTQAPEFGNIIYKNLEQNSLNKIQPELNAADAISIKGNIMLMEGRGRVLFPLYANYISKKGTAGSAQRKTRVRIFGIILPSAILILSPIITVISRLAPILAKNKFRKQIEYYSQNKLMNREK